MNSRPQGGFLGIEPNLKQVHVICTRSRRPLIELVPKKKNVAESSTTSKDESENPSTSTDEATSLPTPPPSFSQKLKKKKEEDEFFLKVHRSPKIGTN